VVEEPVRVATAGGSGGPGGSVGSAGTAGSTVAAGAIGASWWVARARRVLGDDPSDVEAALGIPR
jgi:hypothetical protein